jgi:assimilatory nitrate reductase catalytic subunit
MLSGVSLTNEKSYLIGKFARLALHTANLDYNGRFCMVSAGAGNKKALGIDRAPNPWSDIPLADVVWSPAPTSPRRSRSPPATSGGPATAAPS